MLSTIKYTTEEGGPWINLEVHSVQLPNGVIYDSYFETWRPGKEPEKEIKWT